MISDYRRHAMRSGAMSDAVVGVAHLKKLESMMTAFLEIETLLNLTPRNDVDSDVESF